jgi:NAD(P)-dependent dehydrogenase (short-subunit alcohol dehydrogenase family)
MGLIMQQRFVGRVVIVTGGASGIGAGCVQRFHDEGASVVVADVQDDAGAALAERLGERALFVHCDVGDESSVEQLVDTAVGTFGRLDVFYANAAVLGAVGPIAKLRMEDADATLAVNLRGVILAMKHATRVMQPQGSGVILATASPGGILGGVGPHVYSAAKAGVVGLVQSVAAEVRPYGMRVNAIVPGAMLTPMTADIMTGNPRDLDGAEAALSPSNLMDRPGKPEDIAAAAAFLASDEAVFVTGSTFNIDGGYCHAPGDSPFAKDAWAEPGAMFEAGRRRG